MHARTSDGMDRGMSPVYGYVCRGDYRCKTEQRDAMESRILDLVVSDQIRGKSEA
jgi:hypothetical protein